MANQASSSWDTKATLLMALAACLIGWPITTVRAQLIQQYFPADIPGYEPGFSASMLDRMYLQGQSNGVELGDFVIRPELSENMGYDSNTLASPDSGSSEIDTRASIQANSDWERDALGVSLNVDNLRYLQKPSANYTNWTAGLGGSVDLGNDTLTLAYSRLNLNLAATNLGVAGVVTPVGYSVDDARFSYLKIFGRFSLTPSFEFQNFAFGNSKGAASISYDTLSHRTEGGALTARYERSPGDAAVLILRVSTAQFQLDPRNNYLDTAAFAGLDFQGDRVIEYRILAGVERRSFRDGATKSATTPTFELDAIWTPTGLDTITATGVRRLDDPETPFARDQTLLDGRIELDHELRRNVFLSAYTEAARSDTQSGVTGAGNIAQTQLSLGVSAVWNINQNVSGKISYGYENSHAHSDSRSLTAAESGYASFTRNTILLGVSVFE